MKESVKRLIELAIIGVTVACTYYRGLGTSVGVFLIASAVLKATLWFLYKVNPSFWDKVAELKDGSIPLPNVKELGAGTLKELCVFGIIMCLSGALIIFNPLTRMVVDLVGLVDARVLRVDILVILTAIYVGNTRAARLRTSK